MIKLLIKKDLENNLNGTSFGGLPVKETGSDIEWPQCKICQGEMQYQGKIKTDLGLEMIFMCTSNPGMCDDWDAESGGNKVLIITGNKLEPLKPVNSDLALRKTEYGVVGVEVAEENYDTARANWDQSKGAVLGQLQGQPVWIQGNETPICSCCNQPMRFVAQLEEGPEQQTAMNFGGGSAYLFDCTKDMVAKFLWQC